jgi:outer membrane protein TolC|tara:strand:- start:22937 stop:24448 length:1512 start_codon:yes stop_codon:yes gene_type:complete
MIKKVLLFTFLLTLTAASITLDSSIQLALKNDKRILLQEAQLQSSRSLIKESKGIYDISFVSEVSYLDSTTPSTSAFVSNNTLGEKTTSYKFGFEGYLPTGTSYNFFDFGLKKSETDLGTSAMSPVWNSDLSFRVTQNLLKDFGVKVNDIKILIAKGNSEISKIEFERVVSLVILDTETKYWNTVYTKKNLELALSSLKLAEDIVEKNRIEVEVGTLPKVALLQAESEVAFRKVEHIRAENLYQNSIDVLKLSIGIPIEQDITIDSNISKKVLKKIDSNEIEAIAINNRPEVKQESIKVANSKQLVEYYSNQLLPDLDIEGLISYSGLGGSRNSNYSSAILGSPRIASKYDSGYSDSISSLESLENQTWGLGFKLRIPLNNNIAESKFEVANEEKKKQLILLDRLLDSIHLEARSSYRDVMSNIERIDASKKNLLLQEEVLYNEQARFEVGISKTRDLLEAQRDLIKAQTQYNKSLIEYNVSITSLDYALGILIKENKIVIDN